MTGINNTVSSSTATDTAPGPVTRADSTASLATTVLVSDASRDNLADAVTVDFNLAGFFGDTQITSDAGTVPTVAAATSNTTTPATGSSAPPNKGKTPQRNASPGPSSRPASQTVKEFLDRLRLGEIPPHDKRYDGKLEGRALQRDLHSVAQATGHLFAEVQDHRAETLTVLEAPRIRLCSVERPPPEPC
ncbi:hypothetical protein B0H11DRAFT_1242332 [Mycena galericulata]|nr:hypothetical protein B0H11DRAFT_1242332 [Mycena galericulata]